MMLSQYKQLAVILMIAVISFATAFKIQAWRWSFKRAETVSYYEQKLSEINRVSNLKLIEMQAKQTELKRSLAVLEQSQYEELVNVKKNTDQLINDLSTARKRLSIKTSKYSTIGDGLPIAAPASGLDNEKTRADIDSGDAAAIIKLTQRGDEAIRQLTACQNYINELTK